MSRDIHALKWIVTGSANVGENSEKHFRSYVLKLGDSILHKRAIQYGHQGKKNVGRREGRWMDQQGVLQ